MRKTSFKIRHAARAGRSRVPEAGDVLDYLEQAGGAATEHELARAFGVKRRDRFRLKRVLRELENGGAPQPRRHQSKGPGVAVLDVAALDADGEPLARLASESEEVAPRIRVLPGNGRAPAPAVGDRVLARMLAQDDEPSAEVIRLLRREPERMVGLLQRSREGLVLEPTGNGGRRELLVREEDSLGAAPGDLVIAQRIGGPALGLGRAKVVERLGRPDEPGAISLFAAETFGLPIAFPPEAEAQAAAAQPVALDKRVDLRELPLVTIDGADARDFDDAVYAEPDPDPANPGGWHMVVAIADVAHYVRPGDALDAEARRRGNSVYFPDRVLPMLPEGLANGLCSLRPGEDRACLAVHLWHDRRGRKLRHRFERALMRSRARLTYEQIQAAV